MVASPEEFENKIEDQKARILAANSALPLGAREAYVEFRFSPAVEAATLDQIRTLDNSIWTQIEAEVASGITCLPYFLNQVQLRIFTSLMLGQHFETGRALAVYAGIIDAVLKYYEGCERIDEQMSAEDNENILNVLRDHHAAGDHIGWCMLCYGQSHEFGNYTEVAQAEYERLFGAAQSRTTQFIAATRATP